MSRRISVVIPVYNDRGTLDAALGSLRAQTLTPIEIIVVDDGSDVPIPSHASYQLIRQENKGAPAARNTGLVAASGEFVIFWDADMTATADCLERMVVVLEEDQDASFAYCNVVYGWKRMPAQEWDVEELKKRNYIISTALIRRDDAFQWDESLKRFQDWDYWLTMAEQGKRGVWIDADLLHVAPGGTMSSWLPRIAYNAPFCWLPGVRGRVRAYNQAKRVVQEKHLLV